MPEDRTPPRPDEDSASRDLELIKAARRDFHDSSSAKGSDAAITRATLGGGASDPAGPTTDAFAGYEVIRELSHGGQGVVYQAIEKATKRKVAIKVLLEGPYASASARRRFEREIELVASLKHPNIVAIYHFGLTPDGRQFCVMDYIRGVSLTRYVREQKLPLEAALKLFGTVCEAVQHAHNKGVIHRDLKPANIVVDADGNPKVLDFGLAKQIGGPEQTLVSVTGQVVGTLPYLSPEQARGNPDEIDTRTDVYALGVIFYEMLTGGYPYPVVGQMADVLRHITETEPTPPSREWKSDSGINQRSGRRLKIGRCPIDGELQTIAFKALAKPRDRRYQSARALGRDIGNYLSGEAIEAKRDSALYLLRKTLQRYKLPATIAAAFVITITISVVALSIMYGNQVALRTEADAEAARAATAEQRASKVAEFLQEMIGYADPHAAKRPNLTMRQALDEAARKIGASLRDDPQIEAEVRMSIADAYMSLGEPDLAEPHYREALAIRKDLFGETHESVAASIGGLAWFYHDKADYAEAERLHRQALDMRLAIHGPRHLKVAGSMTSLGDLARHRGDLGTAEAKLREAVDIATDLAGEEHRVALHAVNILALVYDSQRRYAEAETLYERTLEIFGRVLGSEHLDTLAIMGSLADAYQHQRRYAESETLYEQALEIRKRVWGPEHLDTLHTMEMLSRVYRNQRRYAEARTLCEQTLEIRKRVLGPEHSDTLSTMGTLAMVYTHLGRHDEAELLFVKTLEINKRVLGEEHPTTLGYMNNLAILYEDQGRYDEAELLNVKTLEIEERVMGEEHPDTLGSITNLGSLYLLMERFDDARAMYERSLPIKRRVLGMQHPWTRFALSGLARAYDGLDRGDDALPLWRELQEFQLAQVEDPDASAQALNAAAWDLLTNEHADLRDPARALPLAQRAVDKAGGVDPGILDTLALAQHLTGDTPAAIETEKKALSLLPPNAFHRGDYEAALARFEAALKEADTAEEPGGG